MSPLCAADTHPGNEIEQSAEVISEVHDPQEDSPLEFVDGNLKQMSYWKEFFRMMMMLGLILGVVLVLTWFLRSFLNKRIKQVNDNHYIKILERRNLSQKSMVYLIEVFGKQYLIGDSASGGVEYLTQCLQSESTESEIEPLDTKLSKESFLEILQRKLSEKKTKHFNLKK